MNSKLIAINIPSRDLAATRRLLKALIGINPARALSSQVESFHVGVADGVFVWLSPPFYEGDTAPTLYFGVDDLDAAVADVTAGGGKPTYEPICVPIDESTREIYEQTLRERGVKDDLTQEWGRVQMLRDPASGVTIALCQIEPHSQIFFGVGKYRDMRLVSQLHADAARAHALASQLS